MIHRGPREIQDGDARLREVTLEDAPELYRWRMDATSRPMFIQTGEVPYETHVAYLRKYFAPDNTDLWFIMEQEGVPVGTMALHDLDASGTDAEWGRLVVAPEHRRHGVAMRIMRLLMAYARDIGIRRLHSEVLETNARVIATQYELGLRPTEVREHDGRRFVIFAIDL